MYLSIATGTDGWSAAAVGRQRVIGAGLLLDVESKAFANACRCYGNSVGYPRPESGSLRGLDGGLFEQPVAGIDHNDIADIALFVDVELDRYMAFDAAARARGFLRVDRSGRTSVTTWFQRLGFNLVVAANSKF